MQGFSQVNAGDYFPTETARDITNAYSKMGSAQAGIEYQKQLEEERKKQEKKRKIMMGVMLGAAALTGGTAALAAPGAMAAAGGGLMGGLQTFGSGALGALTGAGSVAPGVGGLAGGLSTGAGLLGQIGTSMLTGGSGGMSGDGMGRGGSGGNMDVGQAAMGALGSYMQQVQGANKTSRVMEGVLKDPAAREAAFGSGFGQDQADAVMKYAGTLGATDKASFYQYALPMIGKTAAANTDYQRQLQLQGSRIAQQGDVDLNKIGVASMLDSAGKFPSVQIPAAPAVRPFSPMNLSLGMGTGLQ